MEKEREMLVKELEKLLKGGGAHASLKHALKDLPYNLVSAKPYNLPYSIWQLVDHIKIAQWDMLEFSKNADHKSPKWPEEYWSKEVAPKDEKHWNETVKQIESDLESFINLIQNDDLYQAIPHGNGQSILREALQIADHNAYHTAEIIIIRRLLGAWKS
jgi:hypothetical protein